MVLQTVMLPPTSPTKARAFAFFLAVRRSPAFVSDRRPAPAKANPAQVVRPSTRAHEKWGSSYGIYDANVPNAFNAQTYMFAYVIDYCDDTRGPCLFKLTERGDTEVSVNENKWRAPTQNDLPPGAKLENLKVDHVMLGRNGPTDTLPADLPPGATIRGTYLFGPLKQPIPCGGLVGISCARDAICIRRAILLDAPTAFGVGDPTKKISPFNHIHAFRQNVKQRLEISDTRGFLIGYRYEFTFGRKNKAPFPVELDVTHQAILV